MVLPNVNTLIHWDGAGTVDCVPVLVVGLTYGKTHSGAPVINGMLYDDDPHPATFPSEPQRWHYPQDCPRHGKIVISTLDNVSHLP
jgi:hypothetical protein